MARPACDRCGGGYGVAKAGEPRVLAHLKGCPFYAPEGFPEDTVRTVVKNQQIQWRARLVGVERVLKRAPFDGRVDQEKMRITDAEVETLRAARGDRGLHFARIFPRRVEQVEPRRERTEEEKAATRARIAEMMAKVRGSASAEMPVPMSMLDSPSPFRSEG